MFFLPSSLLLNKILWSLASLGFLTLGTFFASLAGISFNQILVTSSTEQRPVPLGEVPYPAVVVCPVQAYDGWNLQRALLNQVSLFDENGAFIGHRFKAFKVSIRALLGHL